MSASAATTNSDQPILKEIKRANKPMLQWKKWKADDDAKRQARSGVSSDGSGGSGGPSASRARTEEGSNPLIWLMKWLLLAILTSALLSRMTTESWLFGYEGKYSNPRRLLPAKNRVFSEAELALHDGLHPPIPIYLAIDGDVFDVSAGAAYAPGGSYAHFAGKDAARAYVTGCFKTHLTHDIRGFGEKELNSLNYWKKFYADHNSYIKVGRVVHPPIDPSTPLPEPCNK